MFFQENLVSLAVQKVGGVTRASNLLGVANATVYVWQEKGRIPNIDIARKLSELSGVPLEKLRPVQ